MFYRLVSLWNDYINKDIKISVKDIKISVKDIKISAEDIKISVEDITESFNWILGCDLYRIHFNPILINIFLPNDNDTNPDKRKPT